MYVCMYLLPSQELRNGVGTKNRRFVSISNTIDISLDILVGDDRHEFLESVSVSMAIKTMSFQVLNVGIVGQDFGKNSLLDLISVTGGIFNKLKSLLVLLYHTIISAALFWCLRHLVVDSLFRTHTLTRVLTE